MTGCRRVLWVFLIALVLTSTTAFHFALLPTGGAFPFPTSHVVSPPPPSRLYFSPPTSTPPPHSTPTALFGSRRRSQRTKKSDGQSSSYASGPVVEDASSPPSSSSDASSPRASVLPSNANGGKGLEVTGGVTLPSDAKPLVGWVVGGQNGVPEVKMAVCKVDSSYYALDAFCSRCGFGESDGSAVNALAVRIARRQLRSNVVNTLLHRSSQTCGRVRSTRRGPPLASDAPHARRCSTERTGSPRGRPKTSTSPRGWRVWRLRVAPERGLSRTLSL